MKEAGKYEHLVNFQEFCTPNKWLTGRIKWPEMELFHMQLTPLSWLISCIVAKAKRTSKETNNTQIVQQEVL